MIELYENVYHFDRHIAVIAQNIMKCFSRRNARRCNRRPIAKYLQLIIIYTANKGFTDIFIKPLSISLFFGWSITDLFIAFERNKKLERKYVCISSLFPGRISPRWQEHRRMEQSSLTRGCERQICYFEVGVKKTSFKLNCLRLWINVYTGRGRLLTGGKVFGFEDERVRTFTPWFIV